MKKKQSIKELKEEGLVKSAKEIPIKQYNQPVTITIRKEDCATTEEVIKKFGGVDKLIKAVETNIPLPDKFLLDLAEHKLIFGETFDAGERLIQFCKANKTNVEDLFVWLGEHFGKKINPKPPIKTDTKIVPDKSNWRQEQLKRKCNI